MAQQQPNIEARLLHIEGRLAALELARQEQETRDIAILARIDGFIDDLRRIERVQMRAFESQAVQIKEVRDDVKQIQERMAVQERNIAALAEAAKDHKVAIETLAGQVQELAVGQKMLIEILTGGKPPTQD